MVAVRGPVPIGSHLKGLNTTHSAEAVVHVVGPLLLPVEVESGLALCPVGLMAGVVVGGHQPLGRQGGVKAP